jgi:hypothetical protein
MNKTFIICLLIIASAIFSMNIWGGWAEQIYEKKKNDYFIWYWIRFFKKPTNRENCLAFIKGVCSIGLVFSAVGVIFTIIL